MLDLDGFTDAVELGRGGFGIVYAATDVELGRRVAVKLLTAPPEDDASRARFEQEQRLLAQLSNHPNIVTLYRTARTEHGHPLIIMELTQGGSVGNRLRESGAMSEESAVELVRKLAGAVAVAHEAGVVHRDIKPDNVLISDYGEPMLADFGIARFADATATRSGALTATVLYAAPEVLAGAPPTPVADVYSLGALLFAALTGAAAFAVPGENNIFASLSRVANDPVPDLRPRGITTELCDIVEWASFGNRQFAFRRGFLRSFRRRRFLAAARTIRLSLRVL